MRKKRFNHLNSHLLRTIRGMNDAELYLAVFQDQLTGALNRKAYYALGAQKPYVALIDLDSLKYVNDTQGYRAGDKYLIQLVEALSDVFGDQVYRLSGGDEFAVTSDNIVELRRDLALVRKEFPHFSYGLGTGLEGANHSLKYDKKKRTESGERAARGLAPLSAVK